MSVTMLSGGNCPRSVTIASTCRGGVTSKAGFSTISPSSASSSPVISDRSSVERTSFSSRISIATVWPVIVSGWSLIVWAATITGTPRSRALTASPLVPILLMTLPSAAMLSAHEDVIRVVEVPTGRVVNDQCHGDVPLA